MATATVPVKLLVTVSLVVTLVLGLAIGYVVSDATRADLPMQMMSGMDMSDMGAHMDDMSAHMDEMGMDMGSMMGMMSGRTTKGSAAKRMPPMHGHD